MINNYLSQTTKVMKSSLIRELVATTKNVPGLISFAGGFPSPATFPKDILSKLYGEVVAEEGRDVLQYGSSEGDNFLKSELLKWEGYGDLNQDNMIITVGATNAIYYMTRALIDEGDVILCEAPSFLGSLVAFDALGADVQGIPMDAEGLDLHKMMEKVKQLRENGKKIKFLYTIPDFQNPAGVSMSLARRHELLNYCEAEGILVMEDNPYSRLRFSGEVLPTLFRIAHEEMKNSYLVTEIISFSKILGPGMRVAYAKGDATLINKMVSWQQKVNVCPDCVTERVAAKFLAGGYMNPHIQSICDFYKPYLAKMLDSLSVNMPPYVQWTTPSGGIFIWLWLPEDMNADKLFFQAKEHLVTFIPGSKFYPEGQEKFNCLRLNYTYSSLEQIETGIERLAGLIKSIYA
ncbi:MAG: PLP-dependent aminotransferase family protein [Candidatus Cloacimonetes bacterium]|nr:PLP-dependent aminotransferase family protein [Candidatus Cloacimonadota bacterium]MDD3234929.1 PLP-dependent aminotransferase family protein [Candidatus Cloacimonadota bacterium]